MAAPPPGEREILTWPDFGVGTRALAQLVADDAYQGDIVLTIARGGLLPGAAVAYALSIKNVFVMNFEFYTGVDERLDFPVMLPPQLNQVDLKDAHVLIVDDVADTGSTLKAVHDFCLPVVASVRNAVLYEKSHSIVKCEYVWRRTERWIDFPWSDQLPIVAPRRAGGTLEGH